MDSLHGKETFVCVVKYATVAHNSQNIQPVSPNTPPSTAKNLSVRAQKKILTSLGSKTVAKLFIDDRSAHLLDTIHRLTRDYLDNKKRADKLLKYTIKTAIKLAVLISNEQLSPNELVLCGEFRRKLRSVALTFINFHEVEFSFDKAYLSGMMKECAEILKSVAFTHLKGKSLQRIDDVFGFYGNGEWLEWVFLDEKRKGEVESVVADLHELLQEGVL